MSDRTSSRQDSAGAPNRPPRALWRDWRFWLFVVGVVVVFGAAATLHSVTYADQPAAIASVTSASDVFAISSADCAKLTTDPADCAAPNGFYYRRYAKDGVIKLCSVIESHAQTKVNRDCGPAITADYNGDYAGCEKSVLRAADYAAWAMQDTRPYFTVGDELLACNDPEYPEAVLNGSYNQLVTPTIEGS